MSKEPAQILFGADVVVNNVTLADADNVYSELASKLSASGDVVAKQADQVANMATDRIKKSLAQGIVKSVDEALIGIGEKLTQRVGAALEGTGYGKIELDPTVNKEALKKTLGAALQGVGSEFGTLFAAGVAEETEKGLQRSIAAVLGNLSKKEAKLKGKLDLDTSALLELQENPQVIMAVVDFAATALKLENTHFRTNFDVNNLAQLQKKLGNLKVNVQVAGQLLELSGALEKLTGIHKLQIGIDNVEEIEKSLNSLNALIHLRVDPQKLNLRKLEKVAQDAGARAGAKAASSFERAFRRVMRDIQFVVDVRGKLASVDADKTYVVPIHGEVKPQPAPQVQKQAQQTGKPVEHVAATAPTEKAVKQVVQASEPQPKPQRTPRQKPQVSEQQATENRYAASEAYRRQFAGALLSNYSQQYRLTGGNTSGIRSVSVDPKLREQLLKRYKQTGANPLAYGHTGDYLEVFEQLRASGMSTKQIRSQLEASIGKEKADAVARSVQEQMQLKRALQKHGLQELFPQIVRGYDLGQNETRVLRRLGLNPLIEQVQKASKGSFPVFGLDRLPVSVADRYVGRSMSGMGAMESFVRFNGRPERYTGTRSLNSTRDIHSRLGMQRFLLDNAEKLENPEELVKAFRTTMGTDRWHEHTRTSKSGESYTVYRNAKRNPNMPFDLFNLAGYAGVLNESVMGRYLEEMGKAESIQDAEKRVEAIQKAQETFRTPFKQFLHQGLGYPMQKAEEAAASLRPEQFRSVVDTYRDAPTTRERARIFSNRLVRGYVSRNEGAYFSGVLPDHGLQEEEIFWRQQGFSRVFNDEIKSHPVVQRTVQAVNRGVFRRKKSDQDNQMAESAFSNLSRLDEGRATFMQHLKVLEEYSKVAKENGIQAPEIEQMRQELHNRLFKGDSKRANQTGYGMGLSELSIDQTLARYDSVLTFMRDDRFRNAVSGMEKQIGGGLPVTAELKNMLYGKLKPAMKKQTASQFLGFDMDTFLQLEGAINNVGLGDGRRLKHNTIAEAKNLASNFLKDETPEGLDNQTKEQLMQLATQERLLEQAKKDAKANPSSEARARITELQKSVRKLRRIQLDSGKTVTVKGPDGKTTTHKDSYTLGDYYDFQRLVTDKTMPMYDEMYSWAATADIALNPAPKKNTWRGHTLDSLPAHHQRKIRANLGLTPEKGMTKKELRQANLAQLDALTNFNGDLLHVDEMGRPMEARKDKNGRFEPYLEVGGAKLRLKSGKEAQAKLAQEAIDLAQRLGENDPTGRRFLENMVTQFAESQGYVVHREQGGMSFYNQRRVNMKGFEPEEEQGATSIPKRNKPIPQAELDAANKDWASRQGGSGHRNEEAVSPHFDFSTDNDPSGSERYTYLHGVRDFLANIDKDDEFKPNWYAQEVESLRNSELALSKTIEQLEASLGSAKNNPEREKFKGQLDKAVQDRTRMQARLTRLGKHLKLAQTGHLSDIVFAQDYIIPGTNTSVANVLTRVPNALGGSMRDMEAGRNFNRGRLSMEIVGADGLTRRQEFSTTTTSPQAAAAFNILGESTLPYNPKRDMMQRGKFLAGKSKAFYEAGMLQESQTLAGLSRGVMDLANAGNAQDKQKALQYLFEQLKGGGAEILDTHARRYMSGLLPKEMRQKLQYLDNFSASRGQSAAMKLLQTDGEHWNGQVYKSLPEAVTMGRNLVAYAKELRKKAGDKTLPEEERKAAQGTYQTVVGLREQLLAQLHAQGLNPNLFRFRELGVVNKNNFADVIASGATRFADKQSRRIYASSKNLDLEAQEQAAQEEARRPKPAAPAAPPASPPEPPEEPPTTVGHVEKKVDELFKGMTFNGHNVAEMFAGSEEIKIGDQKLPKQQTTLQNMEQRLAQIFATLSKLVDQLQAKVQGALGGVHTKAADQAHIHGVDFVPPSGSTGGGSTSHRESTLAFDPESLRNAKVFSDALTEALDQIVTGKLSKDQLMDFVFEKVGLYKEATADGRGVTRSLFNQAGELLSEDEDLEAFEMAGGKNMTANRFDRLVTEKMRRSTTEMLARLSAEQGIPLSTLAHAVDRIPGRKAYNLDPKVLQGWLTSDRVLPHLKQGDSHTAGAHLKDLFLEPERAIQQQRQNETESLRDQKNAKTWFQRFNYSQDVHKKNQEERDAKNAVLRQQQEENRRKERAAERAALNIQNEETFWRRQGILQQQRDAQRQVQDEQRRQERQQNELERRNYQQTQTAQWDQFRWNRSLNHQNQMEELRDKKYETRRNENRAYQQNVSAERDRVNQERREKEREENRAYNNTQYETRREENRTYQSEQYQKNTQAQRQWSLEQEERRNEERKSTHQKNFEANPQLMGDDGNLHRYKKEDYKGLKEAFGENTLGYAFGSNVSKDLQTDVQKVLKKYLDGTFDVTQARKEMQKVLTRYTEGLSNLAQDFHSNKGRTSKETEAQFAADIFDRTGYRKMGYGELSKEEAFNKLAETRPEMFDILTHQMGRLGQFRGGLNDNSRNELAKVLDDVLVGVVNGDEEAATGQLHETVGSMKNRLQQMGEFQRFLSNPNMVLDRDPLRDSEQRLSYNRMKNMMGAEDRAKVMGGDVDTFQKFANSERLFKERMKFIQNGLVNMGAFMASTVLMGIGTQVGQIFTETQQNRRTMWAALNMNGQNVGDVGIADNTARGISNQMGLARADGITIARSLMQAGMSPKQAAAEAKRFGNILGASGETAAELTGLIDAASSADMRSPAQLAKFVVSRRMSLKQATDALNVIAPALEGMSERDKYNAVAGFSLAGKDFKLSDSMLAREQQMDRLKVYGESAEAGAATSRPLDQFEQTGQAVRNTVENLMKTFGLTITIFNKFVQALLAIVNAVTKVIQMTGPLGQVAVAVGTFAVAISVLKAAMGTIGKLDIVQTFKGMFQEAKQNFQDLKKGAAGAKDWATGKFDQFKTRAQDFRERRQERIEQEVQDKLNQNKKNPIDPNSQKKFTQNGQLSDLDMRLRNAHRRYGEYHLMSGPSGPMEMNMSRMQELQSVLDLRTRQERVEKDLYKKMLLRNQMERVRQQMYQASGMDYNLQRDHLQMIDLHTLDQAREEALSQGKMQRVRELEQIGVDWAANRVSNVAGKGLKRHERNMLHSTAMPVGFDVRDQYGHNFNRIKHQNQQRAQDALTRHQVNKARAQQHREDLTKDKTSKVGDIFENVVGWVMGDLVGAGARKGFDWVAKAFKSGGMKGVGQGLMAGGGRLGASALGMLGGLAANPLTLPLMLGAGAIAAGVGIWNWQKTEQQNQREYEMLFKGKDSRGHSRVRAEDREMQLTEAYAGDLSEEMKNAGYSVEEVRKQIDRMAKSANPAVREHALEVKRMAKEYEEARNAVDAFKGTFERTYAARMTQSRQTGIATIRTDDTTAQLLKNIVGDPNKVELSQPKVTQAWKTKAGGYIGAMDDIWNYNVHSFLFGEKSVNWFGALTGQKSAYYNFKENEDLIKFREAKEDYDRAAYAQGGYAQFDREHAPNIFKQYALDLQQGNNWFGQGFGNFLGWVTGANKDKVDGRKVYQVDLTGNNPGAEAVGQVLSTLDARESAREALRVSLGIKDWSVDSMSRLSRNPKKYKEYLEENQKIEEQLKQGMESYKTSFVENTRLNSSMANVMYAGNARTLQFIRDPQALMQEGQTNMAARQRRMVEAQIAGEKTALELEAVSLAKQKLIVKDGEGYKVNLDSQQFQNATEEAKAKLLEFQRKVAATGERMADLAEQLKDIRIKETLDRAAKTVLDAALDAKNSLLLDKQDTPLMDLGRLVTGENKAPDASGGGLYDLLRNLYNLNNVTPKEESTANVGKVKNFTSDAAEASKIIAEYFGFDPNDVAAIIGYETAGTFDPSIMPKDKDGKLLSSAVGILQFLDSADNKWDGQYFGYSKAQFAQLTATQQAEIAAIPFLTKKGFKKGGGGTLAEIYDAVFGYGYVRGTEGYDKNKQNDTNGNGVIDKGEAVNNEAFTRYKNTRYFDGDPLSGTEESKELLEAREYLQKKMQNPDVAKAAMQLQNFQNNVTNLRTALSEGKLDSKGFNTELDKEIRTVSKTIVPILNDVARKFGFKQISVQEFSASLKRTNNYESLVGELLGDAGAGVQLSNTKAYQQMLEQQTVQTISNPAGFQTQSQAALRKLGLKEIDARIQASKQLADQITQATMGASGAISKNASGDKYVVKQLLNGIQYLMLNPGVMANNAAAKQYTASIEEAFSTYNRTLMSAEFEALQEKGNVTLEQLDKRIDNVLAENPLLSNTERTEQKLAMYRQALNTGNFGEDFEARLLEKIRQEQNQLPKNRMERALALTQTDMSLKQLFQGYRGVQIKDYLSPVRSQVLGILQNPNFTQADKLAYGVEGDPTKITRAGLPLVKGGKLDRLMTVAEIMQNSMNPVGQEFGSFTAKITEAELSRTGYSSFFNRKLPDQLKARMEQLVKKLTPELDAIYGKGNGQAIAANMVYQSELGQFFNTSLQKRDALRTTELSVENSSIKLSRLMGGQIKKTDFRQMSLQEDISLREASKVLSPEELKDAWKKANEFRALAPKFDTAMAMVEQGDVNAAGKLGFEKFQQQEQALQKSLKYLREQKVSEEAINRLLGDRISQMREQSSQYRLQAEQAKIQTGFERESLEILKEEIQTLKNSGLGNLQQLEGYRAKGSYARTVADNNKNTESQKSQFLVELEKDSYSDQAMLGMMQEMGVKTDRYFRPDGSVKREALQQDLKTKRIEFLNNMRDSQNQSALMGYQQQVGQMLLGGVENPLGRYDTLGARLDTYNTFIGDVNPEQKKLLQERYQSLLGLGDENVKQIDQLRKSAYTSMGLGTLTSSQFKQYTSRVTDLPVDVQQLFGNEYQRFFSETVEMRTLRSQLAGQETFTAQDQIELLDKQLSTYGAQLGVSSEEQARKKLKESKNEAERAQLEQYLGFIKSRREAVRVQQIEKRFTDPMLERQNRIEAARKLGDPTELSKVLGTELNGMKSDFNRESKGQTVEQVRNMSKEERGALYEGTAEAVYQLANDIVKTQDDKTQVDRQIDQDRRFTEPLKKVDQLLENARNTGDVGEILKAQEQAVQDLEKNFKDEAKGQKLEDVLKMSASQLSAIYKFDGSYVQATAQKLRQTQLDKELTERQIRQDREFNRPLRAADDLLLEAQQTGDVTEMNRVQGQVLNDLSGTLNEKLKGVMFNGKQVTMEDVVDMDASQLSDLFGFDGQLVQQLAQRVKQTGFDKFKTDTQIRQDRVFVQPMKLADQRLEDARNLGGLVTYSQQLGEEIGTIEGIIKENGKGLDYEKLSKMSDVALQEMFDNDAPRISEAVQKMRAYRTEKRKTDIQIDLDKRLGQPLQDTQLALEEAGLSGSLNTLNTVQYEQLGKLATLFGQNSGGLDVDAVRSMSDIELTEKFKDAAPFIKNLADSIFKLGEESKRTAEQIRQVELESRQNTSRYQLGQFLSRGDGTVDELRARYGGVRSSLQTTFDSTLDKYVNGGQLTPEERAQLLRDAKQGNRQALQNRVSDKEGSVDLLLKTAQQLEGNDLEEAQAVLEYRFRQNIKTLVAGLNLQTVTPDTLQTLREQGEGVLVGTLKESLKLDPAFQGRNIDGLNTTELYELTKNNPRYKAYSEMLLNGGAGNAVYAAAMEYLSGQYTNQSNLMGQAGNFKGALALNTQLLGLAEGDINQTLEKAGVKFRFDKNGDLLNQAMALQAIGGTTQNPVISGYANTLRNLYGQNQGLYQMKATQDMASIQRQFEANKPLYQNPLTMLSWEESQLKANQRYMEQNGYAYLDKDGNIQGSNEALKQTYAQNMQKLVEITEQKGLYLRKEFNELFSSLMQDLRGTLSEGFGVIVQNLMGVSSEQQRAKDIDREMRGKVSNAQTDEQFYRSRIRELEEEYKTLKPGSDRAKQVEADLRMYRQRLSEAKDAVRQLNAEWNRQKDELKTIADILNDIFNRLAQTIINKSIDKLVDVGLGYLFNSIGLGSTGGGTTFAATSQGTGASVPAAMSLNVSLPEGASVQAGPGVQKLSVGTEKPGQEASSGEFRASLPKPDFSLKDLPAADTNPPAPAQETPAQQPNAFGKGFKDVVGGFMPGFAYGQQGGLGSGLLLGGGQVLLNAGMQGLLSGGLAGAGSAIIGAITNPLLMGGVALGALVGAFMNWQEDMKKAKELVKQYQGQNVFQYGLDTMNPELKHMRAVYGRTVTGSNNQVNVNLQVQTLKDFGVSRELSRKVEQEARIKTTKAGLNGG